MEAATASAVRVVVCRPGEPPREVAPGEPHRDGIVWIDVDVRAFAEFSELQAVLELKGLLEPLCSGVDNEMLRDLLDADLWPKRRRYGDVRAISAASAVPTRSEDSDSRAGSLTFQVVEMLAGEGWLVTCWHAPRKFTGSEENPSPERLEDHADAIAEIEGTWVESGAVTAGDLGLIVVEQLVDTYPDVRQALFDWLEAWELDLYRRCNVDVPPDRLTLIELRALLFQYRKTLAPLNAARGKAKDYWFTDVTRAEEAERIDDRIDRALRVVAELSDRLRSALDLVQLQLAQTQGRKTERLQEKFELVAAVLLADAGRGRIRREHGLPRRGGGLGHRGDVRADGGRRHGHAGAAALPAPARGARARGAGRPRGPHAGRRSAERVEKGAGSGGEHPPRGAEVVVDHFDCEAASARLAVPRGTRYLRAVADTADELAKEQLRGEIVKSLEQQGFDVGKDAVSPSLQLDKAGVRALHATAVQHRREALAHRLARYEPELLSWFADGTDVNPVEMAPRLIEVVRGSKEELVFRYAAAHWSIPVSSGYGRRLRYLVLDESNGKVVGIIGLCDPVFRMGARDRWIGWNAEAHRVKLRHIAEAFVLGSVPPYSMILGGKLVALLATSNEVRTAFNRKYAGLSSRIGKTAWDGGLALLTTSSALGRSSIYNRLSYPSGSGYLRIGETRGSGEFHFSNGLYSSLFAHVSATSKPTAKHADWGTGYRNKREVIKKALSDLGLSTEWLYHGISRELFVAPLAENAREYLCGDASALAHVDRPASQVAEYCRQRWIIPRSERMPGYQSWNAASWTLWQTR